MKPDQITLDQFVYFYPRAVRPAVDHLSFKVRAGEVVGLLGPNGAGKTTTLHAVLGLLQPTSGTVRVLGHSPLTGRLKVLPRLSFASADVDLPSNLSVIECLNVFAGLYSVREPKKKIGGLLDQLELAKLRTHLVGTLSAGEQMRLKLLKSLLNDPELLILDEPTRSLDPYMASKVRELLQQLRRERQMTILYTSHNMQEVESFCDRILFLNEGKLLVEGTTAEVLRRLQSRSLEELFIRVAVGGDLFNVS
jgi:ABC-2 type transport system ATP-binding protein